MFRNCTKLSLAANLLIAASMASASAAPLVSAPQLTQLSLSFQDEFDGSNSFTKVKASFTLKNLAGNLTDLQIQLKSKESSVEDPKCTIPPLLVAGGQPIGSVGRTDIGQPISTVFEGQYVVRKYEFTTSFVNANFCKGDWSLNGFHISDDKGEYFYRFLQPTPELEKLGLISYLYSASWDRGIYKPDCSLLGGKSPTITSGTSTFNKYQPCLEIVNANNPIGFYDKELSQANAKREYAEQPTAEQLAAESAAAEKEATKISTNLSKKLTITCLKGKSIKKVTAIKPKCPAGYKVKK
jgi:hypothetical protein